MRAGPWDRHKSHKAQMNLKTLWGKNESYKIKISEACYLLSGP